MDTKPLLLRGREVAELLNISPSKAHLMMSRNEIPGIIRIGRSVRVARESLEEWIREQSEHDDRPRRSS